MKPLFYFFFLPLVWSLILSSSSYAEMPDKAEWKKERHKSAKKSGMGKALKKWKKCCQNAPKSFNSHENFIAYAEAKKDLEAAIDKAGTQVRKKVKDPKKQLEAMEIIQKIGKELKTYGEKVDKSIKERKKEVKEKVDKIYKSMDKKEKEMKDYKVEIDKLIEEMTGINDENDLKEAVAKLDSMADNMQAAFADVSAKMKDFNEMSGEALCHQHALGASAEETEYCLKTMMPSKSRFGELGMLKKMTLQKVEAAKQ